MRQTEMREKIGKNHAEIGARGRVLFFDPAS